MAQLAGKFAGIVEVAVDADKAEALKAALAKLAGLKVSAESAAAQLGAGGTAT
jgi:glycine cleavage system regulatory protein